MTSYVTGPYIEPETLEDRPYQSEVVERATDTSTLVALPTSAGKTPIAIQIMMRRLDQYYSTHSGTTWKGLMVTPNTSLVAQHAESFAEFTTIPEAEISTDYTGNTRPAKRPELWESSSVVIATPQVIKNDLLNDRISLDDVVHFVVDECHNVTPDSSYAYVLEKYHRSADDSLVTALSASPGETDEEVQQVIDLLGVDAVEAYLRDDDQLDQYMADISEATQWLEMPDGKQEALDLLNEQIEAKLTELRDMGVTKNRSASNLSQNDLNKIRQSAGSIDGEEKFIALSRAAELQKAANLTYSLQQALPKASLSKMERWEDVAKKSSAKAWEQNLVEDERFQTAKETLSETVDGGLTPKQQQLLSDTIEIVDEDERVIVFTESRDTARHLVDFFGQYEIDARRFVGQSDKENDDGLSKTEQTERLDAFRAGGFDVLVSTSVGEEGLDVPSVKRVIFFEPASRGIKYIQRMGRTGRADEGSVVIYVTEDSVEEGKYWSMKSKADETESILEELRSADNVDVNTLGASDDEDDSQQTLGEYAGEEDTNSAVSASSADNVGEAATVADSETEQITNAEDVTVLADTREMNSDVVTELDLDEAVELDATNQLAVGDYIVSDRAAGERKSMADFLDTLTGSDERDLFEQVNDLADNYARPFLILEGDLDELYARNIPPAAIHGALTALFLSFNVSIIPSRSEEETASIVSRLAQREQEENDRTVQIRGDKTTMTMQEEQEYIVASIADVGTKTARALLSADQFTTVRDIFTASQSSLEKVDGVGEKTAAHIVDVATQEYS